MEFSRQEYWSGWPFPSPGDLLDPRIEPGSPALQADSLLTEPSGKPLSPQSGIEPTHLTLESKVLATGPPGNSRLIAFYVGDMIGVSVHVLQKQMAGQS